MLSIQLKLCFLALHLRNEKHMPSIGNYASIAQYFKSRVLEAVHVPAG